MEILNIYIYSFMAACIYICNGIYYSHLNSKIGPRCYGLSYLLELECVVAIDNNDVIIIFI